MRVLVTGGAGFIGSHLLTLLVRQGHNVCVIDNLSRGRTEHVPHNVALHVVDITDAGVDRIVGDFRPQAIVHLAAQMDVRASLVDPLHDAETNVLGTVRLLQAALAHGVDVFVLASSGGAAYGEADLLPTPESLAPAPLSPYAASKLCDEIYLSTFCRMGAMRGVSLRPANVYGPRQSVSGETGVVSLFARAMLENRAPIIYGDGTQTRDYVYVQDVARSISLALETRDARGIINIGTEVGTSLRTLADKLRTITGYTGAIHAMGARAGEVLHSTLSRARAQKILGWSPVHALDDGLDALVQSLRADDNAVVPQDAVRLQAPQGARAD